MLKILFPIIGVFIYSLGFAQQQDLLYKEHIDSLVKVNEMQKGKSGKFRWRLGSYTYEIVNKKIRKIVYQYDEGPLNKIDVYFALDSGLIYAEEKEISNYFGNWSGTFYFKNEKLIFMQTLGHGKSETDEWQPEESILKKYQEAVKRINDHLVKNNQSRRD